jgi:hypothetical protein
MRFFRRLAEFSEPEEQLRAQEVRHQVAELPGVEQIAVCRPRRRARVAGIVQAIRVVPQPESTRLEVEIYDGTDQITAVWLGRRRIPGIELGLPVILEGTICSVLDHDLQIINPAYELLAGHE